MIRLSWNLPISVACGPGGSVDVALMVENVSDEATVCCLVCGLFDKERGALVVDPTTGRVAYYGLVVSEVDWGFTLDRDDLTAISLDARETKIFYGTIQPPLTNVLLGVLALNEDQSIQLDAVYTELRAITTTSMLQTMMPYIMFGVVGVIVGVTVGQIAGRK